MSDGLPLTTRTDIGVALRALRHHHSLTQRMLAERARLSPATVARAESEEGPSISASALLLLVAAADAELRLALHSGVSLLPRAHDDATDRAGRRFPAHREIRPVGGFGTWWKDPFLTHPDEWERGPRRPTHSYDVRERWR